MPSADLAALVENMVHQRNKEKIKNDNEEKCAGTEEDGIQNLYTYRLNTFVEVVPDGQRDKMSFWIGEIDEAKTSKDEKLLTI